jgi:hypothetical protein
MGIVYPKEAIARRWNGALRARMQRIPLEEFLKSRLLPIAPPGASQDSDNLVRATVCVVESGLGTYFHDRTRELALRQQALVGHLACLASRATSQVILQPEAWRVVALISITQLLSPWLGLNTAALASASYARRFSYEILQGESAMDARFRECASYAVRQNDSESMAGAVTIIAARLVLASEDGDTPQLAALGRQL